MKAYFFVPVLVVLQFGLIGCSGSRTVAEDGNDISWFIAQIEDSGLSLSTRGAPAGRSRAVSSSRLILNNLDIVDIYEFSEASTALEEGMSLLALRGHRDVYVKDKLLVVHVGRDGSSVRPVLFETLGPAL